MTDARPLQFQPAATPADSTEDLACANLYGLLAMLFFHAADVDLLQRITAAPLDPIGDGDIAAADARAATSSALTQAQQKLITHAGQTTAEQADDKYTGLFIGAGEPEVFLYGLYYQTGFMNEKPLMVLRDGLRRHDLERAEGIMETEGHLTILCEVMRYPIAGNDVAVARIGEQRAFFRRHLTPWVDMACDAVLQRSRAAFYADMAGLAKTFFDMEWLALGLT